MRKILSLMAFMLLALPMMAFGQEVEPDVGGLLSQLISSIGDVKGVSWQVGIAGILAVLISSMKNSFLKELVWNKLGSGKVFVAPVLSMIVVGISVTPFDAKALLLALTTGAGAIALHEVFDALKGMPWIGETWKNVIDVIGKLLGRKK